MEHRRNTFKRISNMAIWGACIAITKAGYTSPNSNSSPSYILMKNPPYGQNILHIDEIRTLKRSYSLISSKHMDKEKLTKKKWIFKPTLYPSTAMQNSHDLMTLEIVECCSSSCHSIDEPNEFISIFDILASLAVPATSLRGEGIDWFLQVSLYYLSFSIVI